MASTLFRGLAAGAAGMSALTIAGYADMALRGRPFAAAPSQTAEALVHRLGGEVPGTGEERDNRLVALGELTGAVVGLSLGVLTAALRRSGLRLGPVTGGVATGAAAMAATDLTMTALGVTDPRRWSGDDWLADAAPHLAYGVVTHAALRAMEDADATAPTPLPGAPAPVPLAGAKRQRAGAALVGRSALLGVAAGGRSSLGLAAPVLASRRAARRGASTAGPGRPRATAALLAVAGELAADKLPGAPPRTRATVLPVRLLSGATGAASMARRSGARSAVPATAGVLGALAGSYGGYAWRRWAGAGRLPDWQAALVEDAVWAALATTVARRGTGAPPARRRTTAADGAVL